MNEYYKIEENLKVGDVVVIVRANHTSHVGRLAVVCEVDKDALGSEAVFAIKYRLDSGFESWGRAVPASGLLKELI